MKKLITCASAIVIAIAAQAASVDWSLNAKNSVMLHDGSAAAEVTVYLLNTGSTTYAKLVADLEAGTVTASTIADQAAYLGSATTGTGKNAGKIASATATSGSLVAGSNYNLAFLIFDKDGDDDYFYLSNVQQASAWQTGTDYSQDLAAVATWDSTTYSSGTWTAVPEPTSGLLLLLGMAGLALKRKSV